MRGLRYARDPHGFLDSLRRRYGDVLSLLLGARDEDGEPMSEEELRDELVTVLAAGHETTATGLAWAIERLLRNPDVLGRLRDSLAGDDDTYLEATIRETLRARPVIVDVARKLTRPIEIGGYELPAGSFLFPAVAALHYRENLFPRPHEFRPERFIDERAELSAPDPEPERAKIRNITVVPAKGALVRLDRPLS